MIIFPAIDLIGGQAVRLLRGDYAKVTVYDKDPVHTALRFKESGAEWIHLVDLEGARDGSMPNRETVKRIRQESGLKCEIGGGIRSVESAAWYLENGIDRVILGTAAVTDPLFAKQCAKLFQGHIAVGADIRDGYVAVKGWTEKSALTCDDFIKHMTDLGLDTFIVTNIAMDGAMQGTDRGLYKHLNDTYNIRVTASGGVSSLADVQALRQMDLYGAIIGKAYYTGAVDLKEAIEAAK